MKVFLGGSLNQTTWRQDVAIPTLERAGIEYCFPGADNPDHACDCDVLLYVVDRQTRALKTCADAISASIGKANVVLVVQHLIAGSYIGATILGQDETKQVNEFRDSVKAICAGLGAEVFSEVEDALRSIVKESMYVEQEVLEANSFGTGEEATTETEESQLPNNDYVNEVVPGPTAEQDASITQQQVLMDQLPPVDLTFDWEAAEVQPVESVEQAPPVETPAELPSSPPESLAEVVIENIKNTVQQEQPVAEVEQLPPSEPTNE